MLLTLRNKKKRKRINPLNPHQVNPLRILKRVPRTPLKAKRRTPPRRRAIPRILIARNKKKRKKKNQLVVSIIIKNEVIRGSIRNQDLNRNNRDPGINHLIDITIIFIIRNIEIIIIIKKAIIVIVEADIPGRGKNRKLINQGIHIIIMQKKVSIIQEKHYIHNNHNNNNHNSNNNHNNNKKSNHHLKDNNQKKLKNKLFISQSMFKNMIRKNKRNEIKLYLLNFK